MVQWKDPSPNMDLELSWSLFIPRENSLIEIWCRNSEGVNVEEYLASNEGEWYTLAEIVDKLPKLILEQIVVELNPDEIAKWRLAEKT